MGVLNCVLTVNNVSGCSSLLSIGLQVPRDRYEAIRKVVSNTLPLGKNRNFKANLGPLFVELDRK